MSAADPAGGPTIETAVRRLRGVFAGAGIDTAALDARLLAAAALGTDAAGLIARGGEPANAAFLERLACFEARRLGREPVARLLGTQEFWGLPFRLGPDTLIPRPDTETLVEEVLTVLRAGCVPGVGAGGEGLHIADVGTGSGAILIALLTELPLARGTGTDLSPGALGLARCNAEVNGVGSRCDFVETSWLDGAGGGFAVIVSNPPYIASAIVEGLQPEVARFEPRLALDGGDDGLDAYRAIVTAAPAHLVAGGLLAVEIGFDQGDAVAALLRESGFRDVALGTDLAGRARVVTGLR